MIWIFLLSTACYLRSFWNDFVSDDSVVYKKVVERTTPLSLNEWLTNPYGLAVHMSYKLFKDNKFIHHFISYFIYTSLCLSLYIVLCKYIPANVSLLAALIFTVHPANCQVGGWISGKGYALSLLLGLWALYFNNLALYLAGCLVACNITLLPLLMHLSIPTKLLSISIAFLLMYRSLKLKDNLVKHEGWFKRDNVRWGWYKLIIATKSFCYYFTQTAFPIRQGWFHELGEPIDEKIKRADFFFALCLLLIVTGLSFLGSPSFLGLFIFTIAILPFSNFVSLGLFTAERYMTPAIAGWSIFLAYQTINYPIVATVFITYYFIRTQLELYAYKDDITLGLYSLANFPNSGFAWSNVSHIFLSEHKPSIAYDMLQEEMKRLPTFPSSYFQMYIMYRSVDLLFNFDKALEYLEKACYYGKHDSWFKELEDFRKVLKEERVVKFTKLIDKLFTKEPIKESVCITT
jgi:hypothetical protein